MIRKVMLLKRDISRNDNFICESVIGFVGFLTKYIAYKDGKIGSRMELKPTLLLYGYKTKTSKRFKVRIIRWLTIKFFIWR